MTIRTAWAAVAEGLDLVSVGHYVVDDHRFLWLAGDGDQTSRDRRDGIIAWGEVGTWSARESRSSADYVDSLAGNMAQCPLPPIVVGGFAFDSARPTTDRWRDFGPGRLIVPATQVIRRDGVTLVQTFGPTQSDADARLTEAQAMIELGRNLGPIEFGPLDVTVHDTTSDHYHDIVKRAVETIERGELDKVVLARAIDIAGQIPLGAWLAALRERFSTCAVFARGEGDRTFFGASPEVLVRVAGESVVTAAIAGTRPRGIDDAADKALADELVSSGKEQAEHKFVVDEIRKRLVGAGVDLARAAPTRVLAIPGIQHLHTPVTGTRDESTSILDLVDVLHPTPAIGGNPNKAAIAWIRDHEDLDRGWYGAPVGWTDTSGQGEFRVGLRSGLHGPQGARLFAGCGIVAGSIPEAELEETHTKFGALLSCLGSR